VISIHLELKDRIYIIELEDKYVIQFGDKVDVHMPKNLMSELKALVEALHYAK